MTAWNLMMSLMISLMWLTSEAEATLCNGAMIQGYLTCSDVISGTLHRTDPSQLSGYPQRCGGIPQRGSEHVYRFRCQQDGNVRLHIHDLSCDVDIYVLDASCIPSSGCIAGEDNPNTIDDKFDFQCKAGQDYFIVLEGYDFQDRRCRSADYRLSFVAGSGIGGCLEDCDDRKDNDLNGQIDCADPNCAQDPACAAPLERCDNGRDDDRDGIIDCADPDCLQDPACAVPERCDNGQDDDRDGGVDCLDLDCAQEPKCAPPEPFRWGAVPPLDFGRLMEGVCADGAARCREATLDLSGATGLPRPLRLVPPKMEGVRLEIQIDGAWVEASTAAPTLESGSPRWPVRLRLDRCCRTGVDGATLRLEVPGEAALEVPIVAQVEPDSWWDCWWPTVVAATVGVIGAWGIYGFIRPSRFTSQAGLLLSRKEDMEEAGFYAIRAHRGTGIGWYRDARVFICGDFALRGWRLRRVPDVIAELRAEGRLVRIKPARGRLEWQDMDGEWQLMPPVETILPAGRLYRVTGRKDFYFEFCWRRG